MWLLDEILVESLLEGPGVIHGNIGIQRAQLRPHGGGDRGGIVGADDERDRPPRLLARRQIDLRVHRLAIGAKHI